MNLKISGAACAVLVLFTAASASADNLGDYLNGRYFKSKIFEHHKIRLRDPDELCLHRIGNAVQARNCVRSRGQMWIRTRRGEVMTPAAQGKCLTSMGSGEAITLAPCVMGDGTSIEVPANQKWGIRGARLKNADGCLAVHVRANKSRVEVKSCSGGNRNQRRFDFGVGVKKPSARAFANLGFDNFRRCLEVELEDNDNCRLDASDAAVTWGFRYWITQERIRADRTRSLDFGEKYSVDRCALAHDGEWISSSDMRLIVNGLDRIENRNPLFEYAVQMNLIHFINCLKRVSSSNDDEEHALNVGMAAFHVPLRCGFHKYAKLTGPPKPGWGLLTAKSDPAVALDGVTEYPSYSEGRCLLK